MPPRAKATISLMKARTPQPRPFRDRHDAGIKLAEALHAYRGARPLVIAIPRGGAPVAYEVAHSLGGDLDVLVARKIIAPDRPELALGAITADGTRRMNPKLRSWSAVSNEALDVIAEQQRALAQAAEARWRAGLPALDASGRIVIVVDDGLATGATVRTVLSSLRQRGAEQLLIAVPVGAPVTCDVVAREVDALICLHRPHAFKAVGHYYEEFAEVSDEEVELLLRRERARRTGALAEMENS